MKVDYRIQAVVCLFGVLIFLAECKATQIVNEPRQRMTEVQKEKQHGEKLATVAEPKIVFESKVYDFGNLGIKEKAECEFRFKNAGLAPLKIGKIKSTCGCTVPSLSKKEYQPGEEGIIRIKYSGQSKPGAVVKHIYVSTNDKGNSKIKLTIKTKVVQLIEVAPQKLRLSWDKKNAGIASITLKSKDGKSFSIKGFFASKDVIRTEFEPNAVASEFVLRPRVDMQKLKKYRRGSIKINLTHPKCSYVTIPYEVAAKFESQPSRIILHNAEPNKPQIREILIRNACNEKFEIESISSRQGYIKTVSQQPDGDKIRVKLQITPPSGIAKARDFSDDLLIKIKNDETFTIGCRGFYRRKFIKDKPTK